VCEPCWFQSLIVRLMEAGFTYAEARGVHVAELPHLLRAIRLRRIDALRERFFLLSLITAGGDAWKEALAGLRREEAALGRRLPSALQRATEPAARERLRQIRERLRHGETERP